MSFIVLYIGLATFLINMNKFYADQTMFLEYINILEETVQAILKKCTVRGSKVIAVETTIVKALKVVFKSFSIA